MAVAYLAGLLAAKLRQVNVKLKHTSGALEDLQALHENIIQSISGGLITTGLDGHITLANAAAQAALELSERDLWGKPVHELFLDPLPLWNRIGSTPKFDTAARMAFKKTFRVRVSALSVKERGTLGYVYTLDDLTEVRRLEREVRMQDRLAAVGRLAAAIAHEIRNPLSSIAGSASMLVSMSNLSDEHRQLLQIVTRESERLNGIITDFLPIRETSNTNSQTSTCCRSWKIPSPCWSTGCWLRTPASPSRGNSLFPKPRRWPMATRSNKSSGISAKTPSAP